MQHPPKAKTRPKVFSVRCVGFVGLFLGLPLTTSHATSPDKPASTAAQLRLPADPQAREMDRCEHPSAWREVPKPLLQSFDPSTLYAPIAEIGANFGSSVDLSQNTAVIGARSASQGEGQVYVADLQGKQWSTPLELEAASLRDRRNFGWSVAIDGEHLAASSRQAKLAAAAAPPLFESGVVSFFRRGSAGWSEVDTIFSPNPATAGAFGLSVDLQGDLALIGEPGANTNTLQRSGAAHIYRRNSAGRWRALQRLQAPDASSDAFFGSTVHLSQRGSATFAFITALGASGAGRLVGKVYVFERRSKREPFLLRESLSPTFEAQGARFGFSLQADQDRLWVGAPGETHPTSGTRLGAVYLFEEQAEGWRLREKLRPPVDDAEALFGLALATNAQHAAIASRPLNSGESVHIFARNLSEDWSFLRSLENAPSPEQGSAADSLALQGTTLIVGMGAREDPQGRSTGAVATYRLERLPAPVAGNLAFTGLGLGLCVLLGAAWRSGSFPREHREIAPG